MKSIFIIVLIIGAVYGEELPKGITTCNRSDEYFKQCLAQAIQDALPILKDGYASFGIPKIEPFTLNYTETESIGGISNFYLKSSLKSAKVHGLTKGKILRAATKFNKGYVIKLENLFEEIAIIGNYTMKGKILFLQIDGDGKCNITLKNVTVSVESYGEYITKDGIKYIDLQNFKIRIRPSRVYYNFENLFKNDKALSDNINSFMNEQWELVSDNLLASYEEKIGQQLTVIANNIYHNVPFDKIFPE